tara:strand:- start:1620 stop:4319 length:2700 start_codon:yes stop_codon:yes gene_type:complete
MKITNNPRGLTNTAASTGTKIDAGGTSSTNTISVNKKEKISGSANIITFDSSKVQIVKQSKKGSITFLIKCEVDVIEMTRNNVRMLRIDFLKNGKNLMDSSQAKPVPTSQTIIDDILNYTSRAEAMQERESINVIKRTFLDTTAYIDNSIAKEITNLSRPEMLKRLKKKRVIEMVTPYSKNTPSKDIPILATPLSLPNEYKEGKYTSTTQLYRDMLLKDSMTPSSFAKPNIVYNSTEKSLSGFTTISAKIARIPGLLTKKVLNNPVKDRITAADGSGKNKETTLIPFVSIVPTDKIIVSKLVVLTNKELRKLGNNPTITVYAFINPAEEEIDKSSCVIDIHAKLAGTTTNSYSPVTSPTGNGIALFSQKVDESSLNLSGLSSFEKSDAMSSITEEKSPNTEISKGPEAASVNVILTRYSSVEPFNIAVPTNTGEMNASIVNLNSKSKFSRSFGTTTIVKAALNKAENVQDFGSFVVPSPTRNLATANSLYGSSAVSDTDNKFISLSAFLNNNGIEIKLGNFQGEYTVAVIRRDTTKKEKSFSHIDTLNQVQSTQIVNSNTSGLTFIDSNVKENHIYEYRAKIFTRSGREIISTGYSIIKYQKLIDNKLDINVSTPVLTTSTSGIIDVNFTVDIELTETNISAVTNILKSQDLDGYFDSELKENRSKLNDLIMIGIKREDLTLGITEDFGILRAGNFSDRRQQNRANVSPLRESRQYRYVISVFLRNPDTMIPGLLKSITDNETGLTYEFSPSKFLHPVTLSSSTLRTKSAIQESNAVDGFNAGFSGAQYFVNVLTASPARLKILGGSVKLNERKMNNIRWKIKGSISNVSHFIIIGSQLGMRSIIGKVHAISSNKTFSFVDKIINKDDGEIQYSVIPVYTDLSMGKESNIGKMTSKSRT